MKLDWLHWLLIAVLLTVGVAIWLTPYRYDRWNRSQQLVRINRFTGGAEALTAEGWRPMVKTEHWTVEAPEEARDDKGK